MRKVRALALASLNREVGRETWIRPLIMLGSERALAVVSRDRGDDYPIIVSAYEETDLREHGSECPEYRVMYEDEACECRSTPLYRAKSGETPE